MLIVSDNCSYWRPLLGYLAYSLQPSPHLSKTSDPFTDRRLMQARTVKCLSPMASSLEL